MSMKMQADINRLQQRVQELEDYIYADKQAPEESEPNGEVVNQRPATKEKLGLPRKSD